MSTWNKIMKADRVADHVKGYMDCMNGLAGKRNASQDYNEGYARRYEIEQRESANTSSEVNT